MCLLENRGTFWPEGGCGLLLRRVVESLQPQQALELGPRQVALCSDLVESMCVAVELQLGGILLLLGCHLVA